MEAQRSRSGPVLIAFDGSEGSEHAIREAGTLLAPRKALVVVVWKEGIGFELVTLPASSIGLPPAQIDVATAREVEDAARERAHRLAQKGAAVAQEAGFDAEGLAVADDTTTKVAETIVRIAEERDAQAVVIGTQGHGRVATVLLGSTSRDVIRFAPCPVVVARTAAERNADKIEG
jgi:nucleotide-binding universal stress UspA family protein